MCFREILQLLEIIDIHTDSITGKNRRTDLRMMQSIKYATVVVSDNSSGFAQTGCIENGGAAVLLVKTIKRIRVSECRRLN
jgi:hypothetical protein